MRTTHSGFRVFELLTYCTDRQNRSTESAARWHVKNNTQNTFLGVRLHKRCSPAHRRPISWREYYTECDRYQGRSYHLLSPLLAGGTGFAWRGGATGIERWTCDQQQPTAGSNPTRGSWVQILILQPWASCSHLCTSVNKQYNLVPVKSRWCSATGKVTAGLAESNGSLPPGGWLIYLWAYTPVGWLPVRRDQLRPQSSVTSMESLYPFLLFSPPFVCLSVC